MVRTFVNKWNVLIDHYDLIFRHSSDVRFRVAKTKFIAANAPEIARLHFVFSTFQL